MRHVAYAGLILSTQNGGDGHFPVKDSKRVRAGRKRPRLDTEPIYFGHWRLIGEFPAVMISGHPSTLLLPQDDGRQGSSVQIEACVQRGLMSLGSPPQRVDDKANHSGIVCRYPPSPWTYCLRMIDPLTAAVADGPPSSQTSTPSSDNKSREILLGFLLRS